MSAAARQVETAQPSAVLYLRVSTREQAEMGGEAEGYSIPAQRQVKSAVVVYGCRRVIFGVVRR